ncbi:MAG: hypothetical protein DMG19_09915 [Acidobacteria bacterium]|nr:MAG: hypothetical protein DMG19_09915 [Acidobacteriota bacterium]
MGELTTGCVESGSMALEVAFRSRFVAIAHDTAIGITAWHPQWPPISRRLLSRLDVRELYERSKDGGVSVLSLRRDRVIRPAETPIRGDHRLPFAPNPA